jgi:hypothetical protein
VIGFCLKENHQKFMSDVHHNNFKFRKTDN